MELKEYQRFTKTTAIYPDDPNQSISAKLGALLYLGNQLASEAGEVSGKIAKLYRDSLVDIGHGQLVVDPDARSMFNAAMSHELGDVAWTLSQIANEMSIDLVEILKTNRKKLIDRQVRGRLKGSGDDR